MVIDCILARLDNEKQLAKGYTHVKTMRGDIIPLTYNPVYFADRVSIYRGGCGGYYASRICGAIWRGDETAAKKWICRYIINNEYNPELCERVNALTWAKGATA